MNDMPLLTSCDQEAIHVPGSIQPHGMLIVTEPDGTVSHVAGDIEGWLGASAWQGATLHALLGDVIADAIPAEPGAGHLTGFAGLLRTPGGEALDVSFFEADGRVIVELEPASPQEAPATAVLQQLEVYSAQFAQAPTLEALCDRAAVAFRALTGFDRVMVYRFLDDEAGRVLAEAKRDNLGTFLHHHFPASDIPRQARALYVRTPTRVIPDIGYRPAPLRPAWTDPAPLDMSDSGLRSVSPTHLHYLANMGVQASASISIIKDGTLWGLIACHNETPRLMPYGVRIMCRTLAGGLARQIKAKEEAEGYRQRIRLRSYEDDIIRLLSREGPLDEVLSNHLTEVCNMLDADGVAALRGTELVGYGVRPPDAAVVALAAWVVGRSGDNVLATAALEADYPAASAFHGTASGLLAMVLATEGPNVLLWFRAEQIEVIEWAGNPHKAAGSVGGVLTPRSSFQAWQETVRGRSRPWTVPEVDAARRLRMGLLDIRQGRRVRELNRQLTLILQDKDQLLEQKDFLIGEVNHRVQNSLQLVSSFLALQGRTSENPELKAALEEARRRLNAVALVHRRLYRGDHLQTVDAGRYVEELCADTISALGDNWAPFLSMSLASVTVPTDRAVTLGLVLTELMININKYAYDGAPGPIEIELSDERTQLRLSVGDKGRGRISSRKGFGTRMMDGLVAQLGGTLTYVDNRPGLRAVLLAPVDPPVRQG